MFKTSRRSIIAHVNKHLSIQTDGSSYELVDRETGIPYDAIFSDIASAVNAAKAQYRYCNECGYFMGSDDICSRDNCLSND